MSLFRDEKPILAVPVVLETKVGYGGTAGGVTLTAGDLPLFQVVDSSGAINIIVLTSGNAIAVRT